MLYDFMSLYVCRTNHCWYGRPQLPSTFLAMMIGRSDGCLVLFDRYPSVGSTKPDVPGQRQQSAHSQHRPSSPRPTQATGMASNDTNDETPMHALLSSFTMIIFSEIGDKTFLIAAILAMKHPRSVVFAGAFGSLVVMSILSAMMGHILPALLPKSITELAAALLFFVFGGKMFFEGREMKAGNQKLHEEMKEAQEEIEEDDVFLDGTNAIPLEAVEEGGRSRHHGSGSSGGKAGSLSEGLRNFFSLFLGPVFVQAFILTFLGEWGDRSQISTIALGAAHVCLFGLLPSSH